MKLRFIKVFLLVWIIFLIPMASFSKESSEIEKYYSMGRKLMKKKNFPYANAVLSKGIKKHPYSLKLLYLRARLKHNYMEDYAGAAMDYSRVIKIDPDYNTKAFWRRGYCLYMLGRYELALKDYNYCLKVRPDYDKVFMLRAKAYAKLGLINRSRQDLEYLIKNHEKYADKAKQLYFRILSKGYYFDEKK